MTSACLRQEDSHLTFSIEINCLAVFAFACLMTMISAGAGSLSFEVPFAVWASRVRPAAQVALIKELTM
jgi:hypothetical protein